MSLGEGNTELNSETYSPQYCSCPIFSITIKLATGSEVGLYDKLKKT